MTEPDEQRSSILPIALAAAIVLFAMSAMWALKFFRTHTCVAQQGTEPQVLADQRQSKNTKGNRFVDDIKDFAITGDRATATVVYHFEKKVDDKVSTPMTFVRENGTWKVCSAGPR
jgi:hypothetical protein